MSEIKPLRMSDWGQSPAPSAPPPPGPPRKEIGKPTAPPPGVEPPPPTIWRGFDLLRLPRGLARRWFVPVPLALLGALLGFGAASYLFQPTAMVTVRLIIRNPQAFAVSEQSYSPSKLQPNTLSAAIRSPQVAREVAGRMGLNVPPAPLLGMIEVTEIKRTEFVDITVTTPWTREETANFASAWAEEAIRFTRKLQADESVEMKKYLEEQVRRNDAGLEEVNRRLSEFSEKRNIVNTEKEMDQYLASIADMNVRYEIGRVDLQACEHRLKSLSEEIRKHSPTFDDLKKAEIKLQELSEYYTDKNPVFLEESDKVEALRRKVNEELQATDLRASDFTGTFVGNALYMQIIDLEAKRDSLTRQNEQVKKMLDEARVRLKELPAVALEMAPLMESAQVLRASRDVLLKRLQEVEVFESLAPGYYRIFKTPAPKDVVISGRFNKLVMLVVLGAGFFGGLGLLVAAGLEYADRTVRTSAEGGAVLGAPCVFALPFQRVVSRPHFSQELWAAVIGPLAAPARLRTFWQVCPGRQTDLFWSSLLEEAQSAGVRILVVHLAGDIPSKLQALPRVDDPYPAPGEEAPRQALWILPTATGLDTLPQVSAALHAARDRYNDIWLSGTGAVREPASSLARLADRVVMILTLNVEGRDFWNTQKTLLVAPRALDGYLAMDRP